MTVLAIDTSTRSRITCVLSSREGHVVRADTRTESSVDVALPSALASLLEDSVEALVVVVGPGSYTGVRAGMAAALGLADARALPLFGAGTLGVVAAGARAEGAERGWAVADAGRGALYAARFDAGDDDAINVRRITLDGFDAAGGPVYALDPMPVAGLRELDPAVALASSVPLALARGALQRHELRAVFINE